VLNKKQKQTFKQSAVEILLLIRTCLTSFWFWLPVLFAIFIYLQLFMFFYVHPLVIFIVPAILSLYAIRQDKKRLEARYDLKKNSARSDHLDTVPYSISLEQDIQKRVEGYEAWMKKRNKK